MEQQSNNNFDALFQKAAEDYPLKTDNSNWNIVDAQLRTTAISSTAYKSRRWQYAAVLLLLLSAGSFFYFFSKPANSTDQTANTQSKIISGKNIKQLSVSNKNGAKVTAKNFRGQLNNIDTKSNLIKQLDNNSISNSISPSDTKPHNQQNFVPENEITSAKINRTKDDAVSVKTQTSFSPVSPLQIFSNPDRNNQDDKTVDAVKNNTQLNSENVQNNNIKNNKPDNLKGTESQRIKLAPQPKLLYGELFFAPDFSTVKLQNVNAPGYNIGIAIGYKISKRLSAELGLERLHTDFYSNAKYLDKSPLKLKPNTTVQFVNGKSKLTEVPFDIKYILSKKNDHFYITMGSNIARITHTEKYNYQVIKDGTRHAASKHFGALTGTKFFSDLNFSAGYQTKLSGSFNLKAEPFYQVPLKGLGVGNLPVTNFGVSIGIIKDLK